MNQVPGTIAGPGGEADMNLRQKLRDRTPVHGTWIFSSDPAMTEIAASAGFEFVIVDREHTALSWSDITGHARAAAACGASLLVRIAEPSATEVMHALDLGAAGVVIPHFGLDAEATLSAARAMRYAPEGDRGTCTGVRINQYGLGDFAEVARRSNEEAVIVALVEDPDVLPRLPAILDEIAVDAVFPGLADLSAALGLAGQFGHPTVIEAVDSLMASAMARGIPVGAYVANPSQMSKWLGGAASFFVYSIDYKIVAEGYRTARAAFRDAVRIPGDRA
jgi:2-keto-3-deoxy-L-rhamnonate aldolase RhmA